jgi:DNA-binding NtrC family response regulator
MYLTPLPSLKASILVMDSDSAMEARLRRLLAEEGFRIAEVAAGRDSGTPLDAAIDLVIAGVAAGQDLAAVTAAIPPCARSAPVVALVDQRAWTGFDFFDAANALGATAVLQKPFPRTALLRLIATVLSQPRDRTDADGQDPIGAPEIFFSHGHLHLA